MEGTTDLTNAEEQAATSTAEAVALEATAEAVGATAGTEDDEDIDLRERLLQIEAAVAAS